MRLPHTGRSTALNIGPRYHWADFGDLIGDCLIMVADDQARKGQLVRPRWETAGVTFSDIPGRAVAPPRGDPLKRTRISVRVIFVTDLGLFVTLHVTSRSRL
jgi:hypothetical protein